MVKLTPNLNPRGWDECFLKMVRDYRQVLQTLESLNLETLNKNTIWLLTFFVNSTYLLFTGDGNKNRIFPFDIIPRILTKKTDWKETGITQRLRALNFFGDIYNEQLIVIIPAINNICLHYLKFIKAA
jgi:uncharacterized circularly permuted ATP-grasp superfamily protein